MPKPQPWYAKFNQPAWSPNGRNWKPSPKAHGRPADRASDGTGAIIAFDYSTFTISWDLTKPSAPAIPYAGIRAGELTGYRAWHVVEGNQLCSLAHHFIWEPNATIEGDINKVVWSDYGTFEQLYGGVYCFDTKNKLALEELKATLVHYPTFMSLESNPTHSILLTGMAFGTIKLWGEVIEHELGYRGQFAKLTSIDEVIGVADIDALRRKYNV